nr:MAG TPA: hypothetical protein [Caudoviricetes sp.]DAO70723.1 MAG TPA: hypothetical protein [Caudoviricetes sp.]DAT91930.1 MAG TPA: hypothetical protein [Caudoviricetes sp.]
MQPYHHLREYNNTKLKKTQVFFKKTCEKLNFFTKNY